MKANSRPAEEVDEYLAEQPQAMQKLLQKVRKAIQSCAPEAEETISYMMPAYRYHGMLVYFAAFKNHCSLFPASQAVFKQFGKELKPFKTSKGTIQFTLENPLPTVLVKAIVKFRMKENEERAMLKRKKKQDEKFHLIR